ncbi:MAG: branched-chain amino acid ABC transporter permease [Betaproteobacteria bacterium]|nr:branched-chain amino acid ABC transporter permease [Betaproteobacteria bacterium]
MRASSRADARRTWWWATPRSGGIAALALVVAVLPLGFANGYFYDVAIQAGLNSIICVGLNLLIGYAGQISLGHAGFFALGAYGSALLAARYGWPPSLALVTAVAGVALVAYCVGRPILRLKGHYLAMATLGFGVIVSIVLANDDRLTGGPDGMQVPPFALAGYVARSDHAWYAIVGACLLAAVWLAQNLVESPTGRALRALHTSEVAAAIAGIDCPRHKVNVFVVSAVFAAAAGGLTAYYAGFITPSSASFVRSVELVTMVVFGGMASTFGAVVGATVLTVLPQALTVLKEYELAVFGALLMATMVFLPRGVVPTLSGLLQRGTR